MRVWHPLNKLMKQIKDDSYKDFETRDLLVAVLYPTPSKHKSSVFVCYKINTLNTHERARIYKSIMCYKL